MWYLVVNQFVISYRISINVKRVKWDMKNVVQMFFIINSHKLISFILRLFQGF